MTQQSPHLSPPDLELLYLGEPAAHVADHVRGCGLCRRALESLEAEAAALLERQPPMTFLHRLQADDERQRRGRSLWRNAWGGLAVAATAVIWVAAQGSNLGSELDRIASSARDTAPTPAATAPIPMAEGLVPKGHAALSIIRQRGEEQRALHDPVAVAPGDRIRLSFTLEVAGPIVAGVLTDDGGWLPLLEGAFVAGTHTPSATLRVTEDPGAGLVLLGPPEAVAAARAGKAAPGVQRAQLVWSRTPLVEKTVPLSTPLPSER